ncbi:MAG: histidine kinase [Salinivirgaceae bacterium]|nr:histidine kinase [Salinivirgaceae bacterium]
MHNLRTNKLFWILQTVGWALYYISYVLIFYFGKMKWGDKQETFDLKNFLLFSLTYILAFLFTLILRYIYRYFYNKIEKLIWLPVIILLASFSISALMHFIDLYVSHYFWGEKGAMVLKARLSFRYFIMGNYNHLVVFTGWSALYFGIKYAFDWQQEKGRSRDAEMMAQKAQMAMLRYQLNPHFLFNSLNSIRALVDENQDHAKEMITELSEFLRYSLLHKDTTFVTLSNELEAVKHYFSIEKKRFEEKLEISYNIADNTKNLQILSFLLHPLIENAVKYGMKTSTMPLKISVGAQKTGVGLMLEICNSGKWIERNGDENHSGGTGTGLKNVEKRLENAYEDNYRFETIVSEHNICIRIEIKEAYLHG